MIAVRRCVPLDDVQRFTMEIAGPVEPRLVGEVNHVDDERIAFPAASGIAHEPAVDRTFRVRCAIGINVPCHVAVLIQDGDVGRRLHDLKWEWHVGDPRNAWLETPGFRIGSAPVLIVLALFCSGPWLIGNLVSLNDSLAGWNTE